jgi:hypothetical protein
MIRNKKITHEVKSLFPLLKSALEKEEELIFGYIFGSYGRGHPSLLSDVDIAVYMDERVEDRFDKRLDLIEVINSILKTNEVDLVVLNEAPLRIAFQVLKTKRLLFSKNDAKRIEFEVRTIKIYLDTEILRKRAWEAMKRRIEEDRYGY